MTDLRSLAENARAGPFQEARRLVERFGETAPEKGHVLFETGYGPSGLPHIGTFGEVARTTMVRRAFALLSDVPTKLFCFSDDMDGLRKVPDNVPSPEKLEEFIGLPLTQVPDPFGTHESFGHHNNARLRAFLDAFGFEYEFQSATDWYTSGGFDQALLHILAHHDAVADIIKPTLGEERRATYSPFLPVSPQTGHVLLAEVVETKPEAGTIVYKDYEQGDALVEVPVTGGQCKLQWKADWAMRWFALGVDYEMSGKDLIDSVKLSSAICRRLGGTPPESFTYELFLDEEGQKISKSKGNGLSVDEWLTYGPQESLALFMYHQPRRAKRLFFDVIPKHVDEYLGFIEKFPQQDAAERLENPVWHIHGGTPPAPDAEIGFGLLLNLASVCQASEEETLWGYISRYAPEVTPENAPLLAKLVGYAVRYYQDFVAPTNVYRAPDETERAALLDLAETLESLPRDMASEDIQSHVYEVGKRHDFANLRDWFKACYEVLLGQEQGPRLGSFIALYGVQETAALIKRALAGENLAA
jgi:lysyl-tRNA synthetase class 1